MPEHGPGLSPRRRELLAAATRVVAEHGLRGLTHRAVDREVGLSEGSCSAYYRTSRALREALAQYVAAAVADDVAALAEELRAYGPGDDRRVELTGQLFWRWLQDRDVLLARLELDLAATRDAELAAMLADWRARLVSLVASIATDRSPRDAADRAEALVAAADGVLMAALLRPVRGRRAFVTSALERLLGGLAADPA